VKYIGGGEDNIKQIKLNVKQNDIIYKIMLPEDSTAEKLILLVNNKLDVDMSCKQMKLFKDEVEIVNSYNYSNSYTKLNELGIVDGDEVVIIIEPSKCETCQAPAIHSFGRLSMCCCGNCCPACRGFGSR
jgi:hypothetical protein